MSYQQIGSLLWEFSPKTHTQLSHSVDASFFTKGTDPLTLKKRANASGILIERSPAVNIVQKCF